MIQRYEITFDDANEAHIAPDDAGRYVKYDEYIDELQASESAKQAEYNALKETSNAKIAELEGRIAEKQSTINSLTDQAVQLSSNLRSLQAQNDSLISELNSLRQQVTNLQADYQTLTDNYEVVSQRLTTATSDATERTKQLADSLTANNRIRQNVQTAVTTLQNLLQTS